MKCDVLFWPALLVSQILDPRYCSFQMLQGSFVVLFGRFIVCPTFFFSFFVLSVVFWSSLSRPAHTYLHLSISFSPSDTTTLFHQLLSVVDGSSLKEISLRLGSLVPCARMQTFTTALVLVCCGSYSRHRDARDVGYGARDCLKCLLLLTTLRRFDQMSCDVTPKQELTHHSNEPRP